MCILRSRTILDVMDGDGWYAPRCKKCRKKIGIWWRLADDPAAEWIEAQSSLCFACTLHLVPPSDRAELLAHYWSIEQEARALGFDDEMLTSPCTPTLIVQRHFNLLRRPENLYRETYLIAGITPEATLDQAKDSLSPYPLYVIDPSPLSGSDADYESFKFDGFSAADVQHVFREFGINSPMSVVTIRVGFRARDKLARSASISLRWDIASPASQYVQADSGRDLITRQQYQALQSVVSDMLYGSAPAGRRPRDPETVRARLIELADVFMRKTGRGAKSLEDFAGELEIPTSTIKDQVRAAGFPSWSYFHKRYLSGPSRGRHPIR